VVAKINSVFLQFLPKPPLTPDQVRLMAHDNIASGKLPGLKELGITPQDAEAVLPSYLAGQRGPDLQ
jgi:NADH dehydrogenase